MILLGAKETNENLREMNETLGVRVEQRARELERLALALPAFRETESDWLKTQDLAITFLDRAGGKNRKCGGEHHEDRCQGEFAHGPSS